MPPRILRAGLAEPPGRGLAVASRLLKIAQHAFAHLSIAAASAPAIISAEVKGAFGGSKPAANCLASAPGIIDLYHASFGDRVLRSTSRWRAPRPRREPGLALRRSQVRLAARPACIRRECRRRCRRRPAPTSRTGPPGANCSCGL